MINWFWHHWLWLWLTAVVLPCMGLELMWWSVVWLRGREIDFNGHAAVYWTSGPQTGQRRRKPINIKKAVAREYSWVSLGLPFTLVAAGFYLDQLWSGTAREYVLIAVLWYVTTPLRKIAGILAARKVWAHSNPDKRLDTTWLEDVRGYYGAGLYRLEVSTADYEPAFEGRTIFTRILNWLDRNFGKYGTFWRLWNIFRYWGLVVQALVSLAWPVSAVIAPFYYMEVVDDYQFWHRPWWRRYRRSKYESKFTPLDPSSN